jgi:hypothetical protein
LLPEAVPTYGLERRQKNGSRRAWNITFSSGTTMHFGVTSTGFR